MKKFRVLKAFGDFAIGTIINCEPDGQIRYWNAGVQYHPDPLSVTTAQEAGVIEEISWPASGDGYFYISSKGRVKSDIWQNGPKQNMRRQFGNFFKTLEQAMAARDKVGEMLTVYPQPDNDVC